MWIQYYLRLLLMDESIIALIDIAWAGLIGMACSCSYHEFHKEGIRFVLAEGTVVGGIMPSVSRSLYPQDAVL